MPTKKTTTDVAKIILERNGKLELSATSYHHDDKLTHIKLMRIVTATEDPNSKAEAIDHISFQSVEELKTMQVLITELLSQIQ